MRALTRVVEPRGTRPWARAKARAVRIADHGLQRAVPSALASSADPSLQRADDGDVEDRSRRESPKHVATLTLCAHEMIRRDGMHYEFVNHQYRILTPPCHRSPVEAPRPCPLLRRLPEPPSPRRHRTGYVRDLELKRAPAPRRPRQTSTPRGVSHA